MTSVDWPNVRAGIAAVIATIPEIKRVNAYEKKGLANNDVPFALLYREYIQGPGMSLGGEEVGDEGLGQYSHLVTWRIEIYASIRSLRYAQELDDLFATRLLDAFNSSTGRLIDPNGPGVVDSSRLTEITAFQQSDIGNQLWVTTATLQTKIISTT